MVVANKTYPQWQVFYRTRGRKVFSFVNSKIEAGRLRSQLRRNKKKFLGMREVELVEVVSK